MPVSLDQLHTAMPSDGLFAGGEWQWSPEPLKLTKAEARMITRLGHPISRFQQSCDTIYRRSATGNLPGWISELLDFGKPDWMVHHQREPEMAGKQAAVIRPDLLLTNDGLALTELDSVPGGIGVTAWLSRTYAQAGHNVLGGAEGMIDGFRSILPDGADILVSEEAGDYRPEMEWLVSQLGVGWKTQSAEEYQSCGERAAYRFFELFDWESVSEIRHIADAVAAGKMTITPPIKPHLEDKLWLALLWSPALRLVWERTLRGSHLQRMREITPFGWVLDPEPLPPHASLPRLDAHDWDEVARFSQKERQLVLKISGFHETAWGSRGVFIGHDLSAEEWKSRLRHALDQAGEQPWLMQEFREGRLVEHPVFRSDGSVEIMRGRVRLCPYFFTNRDGLTVFGGCLATIAPADKKKIHGMTDAVLVPCEIE